MEKKKSCQERQERQAQEWGEKIEGLRKKAALAKGEKEARL